MCRLSGKPRHSSRKKYHRVLCECQKEKPRRPLPRQSRKIKSPQNRCPAEITPLAYAYEYARLYPRIKKPLCINFPPPRWLLLLTFKRFAKRLNVSPREKVLCFYLLNLIEHPSDGLNHGRIGSPAGGLFILLRIGRSFTSSCGSKASVMRP